MDEYRDTYEEEEDGDIEGFEGMDPADFSDKLDSLMFHFFGNAQSRGMPIFGGDYVLMIVNYAKTKMDKSSTLYLEITPTDGPRRHPDIDVITLVQIIKTTQLINICVSFLLHSAVWDSR